MACSWDQVTFLSELSEEYFCILDTSVSAEEDFSTAGHVVTAEKNKSHANMFWLETLKQSFYKLPNPRRKLVFNNFGRLRMCNV